MTWSRTEKIGVGGLLVAIITCAATIALVPPIQQWLWQSKRITRDVKEENGIKVDRWSGEWQLSIEGELGEAHNGKITLEAHSQYPNPIVTGSFLYLNSGRVTSGSLEARLEMNGNSMSGSWKDSQGRFGRMTLLLTAEAGTISGSYAVDKRGETGGLTQAGRFEEHNTWRATKVR